MSSIQYSCGMWFGGLFHATNQWATSHLYCDWHEQKINKRGCLLLPIHVHFVCCILAPFQALRHQTLITEKMLFFYFRTPELLGKFYGPFLNEFLFVEVESIETVDEIESQLTAHVDCWATEKGLGVLNKSEFLFGGFFFSRRFSWHIRWVPGNQWPD